MDTNDLIDRIYHRHMAAMQRVGDTHKELHGSMIGFSLHIALAELAAAMQGDDQNAQVASMRQQILQLEADNARITAELRSELESTVEPLAHWLLSNAPELCHDQTTTLAEAVLIALQRGAQATLQGIERAAALTQEIDLQRQQILQLEADNARITAELRTERSWSITIDAPEAP